jgi:hypothetical protein
METFGLSFATIKDNFQYGENENDVIKRDSFDYAIG